MKYKQGSVYCFAEAGEEIADGLADIDVENLPIDAEVPLTIPIFREGKFEHPYYDELIFDEKYLNRMIENYDRRVLPRDVSFDADHRQFDGRALAWIRKDVDNPLELRDVSVPSPTGDDRTMKVLFAHVYLNRRGAQMIKGKEYKYFSSEINPNYTTREKVKLSGSKDLQVLEHGPVLLGGGLTNNPFIPGLGEYEFSDSNGNPIAKSEEEYLLTDVSAGIQLFTMPHQEVEELEVTGANEEEPLGLAPPVQPASSKEDKPAMFGDKPMEEILQKFAGADTDEQRLRILQDAAQQYTADPVASATLSSLRATVQKSIDDKQAFDALIAENQRNADRVNQLSSENVGLKIEAAKAKEGSHTKGVELFCEELRKNGHHESQIQVARSVLLNSDVATREVAYKFDADSEEAVSLKDVLKAVFAAMPEQAKLDLSEGLKTKEDELRETSPVTTPAGEPQEFNEGGDDDAVIAAKVEKFEQIYGVKPEEADLPYIDNDGKLNAVPVEE